MEKNKYLANCQSNHIFWVCDGRILKNTMELADALETMSDDTYRYHSNSEKNDFYSWTKDILKDMKLAKDLKSARNRESAAKKTRERINHLLNRKTRSAKRPKK